jgi:hypothetical protein
MMRARSSDVVLLMPGQSGKSRFIASAHEAGYSAITFFTNFQDSS